MVRKIELGSPSFMGAAIASIVSAFADAAYPIKVAITNNMPRDISLPDVGLFLRHVCNPDGENRREVELQGFDQLQRLASNIGQISMLNDYQYAAMTVEEVVDEPEQGGDEEAKAKADAEAESARVQVELDAAAEKAKADAEKEAAEAEAKAKAELEQKAGDESGSEKEPDLTGTGDETGGDEAGAGDETETDFGLTGSGEGETDDSDPEKDDNPEASVTKSAKTKKGGK